MDDKKQLTIVMLATVQYANKQSLKEIKEAVQFVNWVNSFELENKEGYIILKVKGDET